jgi:hypothetical protein
MKDNTDYETVIGNSQLCAWATDECETRIQSRDRQFTKQLKRNSEIRRVGYAALGPYLELFSIKRTLPWVGREVIEKILNSKTTPNP